MTSPVDLIIEGVSRLLFAGETNGPGDFLPGDPQFLEDVSIAINEDKIQAIGPAKEIAGHFHASKSIDARGKLVTPGFVDSHTHLVFAGDRSGEFEMRCRGADYEEIAAAGGGIRASVRHTRAASEDELFEESLPRLQRMLALGTTTVEIKSGYGLDLETELRMLRVARRLGEATPARVVTTFMGAHEFPDEHRSDRDRYVDVSLRGDDSRCCSRGSR